MDALATVKEYSSANKAVSTYLRGLLNKLGYSMIGFAELLRRSPSIVKRFCDPRAKESIKVADLLLESVPDEIVIGLINFVLDARGYAPAAKRSIYPTGPDLLEALSEITGASSGVIQHLALSLKDGQMDAAEAKRFLELSARSRSVHAGLEQAMRRIVDADKNYKVAV